VPSPAAEYVSGGSTTPFTGRRNRRRPGFVENHFRVNEFQLPDEPICAAPVGTRSETAKVFMVHRHASFSIPYTPRRNCAGCTRVAGVHDTDELPVSTTAVLRTLRLLRQSGRREHAQHHAIVSLRIVPLDQTIIARPVRRRYR